MQADVLSYVIEWKPMLPDFQKSYIRIACIINKC